VARRELTADQADASRADDREPDAFRFLSCHDAGTWFNEA